MNKFLVFFGVILSTFFWGSNFNAGSYVVSHIPPIIGAAERFVIATIFIVVYLFFKEKDILYVLRNNLISFILLGLLGIAGFNISLFVGLKTTSAVNGALIMATTPITTTLLSALIVKNRIKLKQLIGMIISFTGVAFVITKGSFSNLLDADYSIGDVTILLGSICWSCYTVGCNRFISDSTPLKTTSFTMLFGTLGIIFVAANGSGNVIEILTQAPKSVHIASVYMGFAGSVLAYLFWNIGLKNIGPSNTSIFFNLVPVFTMLITSFFGLIPSKVQIFGSIAVIIGVIIFTGGYEILSRKMILSTAKH